MKHRTRLRFQDHVLLLVAGTAAPAWFTAAFLLWNWDASPVLRTGLFALISILAVVGALAVRTRVVRPLQSLANIIEALREGDYSVRGRDIGPEDALGEVMVEINSLSRTLHDQRLEVFETGMLLEKVIAEIDIAVFAFDAEHRLRLVNRAGASLLHDSAAQLLGRSATELGLATMLDERSGPIAPCVFPGGAGRWEIRRRSFREGGRAHQLLVISDLSRALREEERQTWRRLVRVIGHELNSSLTPIKSIAGALRDLIDREPPPDDWRADARNGLSIIHDRAGALARFMNAYARLARLPPPTRGAVDIASLVRRAVSLHGGRIPIAVGPEMTLRVDADQIEHVLINLITNAVEASRDASGVNVSWRAENDRLVVEVRDDGPGLARTDNLWVPFFTTKRGGTGIGLVLSREIIENHGGMLTLQNRPGARGCVARISLPMVLEEDQRNGSPSRHQAAKTST